jgi:putative DNA primase/helicase
MATKPPDDVYAKIARTEALFAEQVDRRFNEQARAPVWRGQCDDDLFPRTEAGDSEFFASRAAGRFLYDHAQQRWFLFDGHAWRLDNTREVIQAALASMRERTTLATQLPAGQIRDDAIKWALRGESEKRIEHALSLAATLPLFRTDGTEWDPDPLLLGVANGVVSLADGTLRDGRPEDRITRVSPMAYDAAALAPRWTQFILEIADGRHALAEYLQTSLGYAATGVTSEQCFWIWYGAGANGKSTALETLTRHVLPQHSWRMPFPTAAWSEALSEYQRAELVGRRIVASAESEERKRLNSEFIKSLTGCEAVNARRVYGRPFQFTPQCKFFLLCNHRPTIHDQSRGMWRRVRLVPFERTFAVDPALPEQLAAEAPGILAWLVRGAIAWRSGGFRTPEAVTAATAAYQTENDPLAAFLVARCVVADHAQVRAGVAYQAYQAWAADEHFSAPDTLSGRAFGELMKARFQSAAGKYVTYLGVDIVTASATERE